MITIETSAEKNLIKNVSEFVDRGGVGDDIFVKYAPFFSIRKNNEAFLRIVKSFTQPIEQDKKYPSHPDISLSTVARAYIKTIPTNEKDDNGRNKVEKYLAGIYRLYNYYNTPAFTANNDELKSALSIFKEDSNKYSEYIENTLKAKREEYKRKQQSRQNV